LGNGNWYEKRKQKIEWENKKNESEEKREGKG
jgi:hypothetical protein